MSQIYEEIKWNVFLTLIPVINACFYYPFHLANFVGLPLLYLILEAFFREILNVLVNALFVERYESKGDT